MKIIQTTLSTGDKVTSPGTNLTGEIGTIKDGKIKILWYINEYSGFSEFISVKELNRRINNNKIVKTTIQK